MPFQFNPFTGQFDKVKKPAGLDTQVQYNDDGKFGADAGLIFEKTTDKLTVGSTVQVDGTGQSYFTEGLIINQAQGSTATDDFEANTLNVSNALQVNASEDLISINTGLTKSISTKTGDYTLTNQDCTILADCTSTSITLTLPASPATGIVYNLKCVDSTNTCIVDRNGKNIDGDASNITLIEDETITIQYDGTEWWII